MMNTAALSDAELAALEADLSSAMMHERAMDVCTLHGFVTALLIGPRMVMPSVWLPWVWDLEEGRLEPEFANTDEANRVVGGVMRLYNDAATRLAARPEEFEALFRHEALGGGPAEWCEGFYAAMRLDLSSWTPLLVAEPKLFAPILVLGEPEKAGALERWTPQDIGELVDAVEPNVLRMRAYWREHGDFGAATSSPGPLRRDAPKLGRNDPCHCGSGRKYKKCHGAT